MSLTSSILSLGKNKLTAAALALGLVGVGTGFAQAKPDRKGPDGKRGGKIERLCKKLECSDSQREQIKTTLKNGKSKAKNGNHKAQVESIKAQLAAEYKKARPNQQVMKSLYNKLDALADQRRDAMHATAMQIHGVLTPAQREKVAEGIERRGLKALMGGGKGKHGKRGPDGKRGKKGKRGKGKGKGKFKNSKRAQ